MEMPRLAGGKNISELLPAQSYSQKPHHELIAPTESFFLKILWTLGLHLASTEPDDSGLYEQPMTDSSGAALPGDKPVHLPVSLSHHPGEQVPFCKANQSHEKTLKALEPFLPSPPFPFFSF